MKKICKNCSKDLSNINSIYCSNTCHNSYLYRTYIEKWLSGVESETTKYGATSQVKSWIRSRYGLMCWSCGWNKPHPETGIPPLQLDHIDGDAMNNRPENLRLLCGSCHSLTSTYGNRGGRTSTRTYRYNNDK